MCGIYGYIGHNAISKSVLGLEKLEYRGYDSSGIAFANSNNEIEIVKAVGKVSVLKEKVDLKQKSNLALAHTRWATHGKPTIENSHPHTSENFIIVHNGIIENYVSLKKEFNIKTKTETDSEIIAHLLEIKFNKNLKKTDEINKNILKSIKFVQEKLIGSWGVGVICKKIPNKIYLFKKSNPLVVGTNGVECAVSSDINAFDDGSKSSWEYFTLDDGNICELSQNNLKIYNNKLQEISIEKTEKIKNNSLNSKKFKFKMLKEINEIPISLKNTKKSIKNEKALEFIEKFNNFSSITIVGCGTAYHAGLYGKFILEKYTGKFVDTELASEFRYKTQIKEENSLVLAISQSGETADTLAALELAKSNGATTAVITNVKGSTITKICDYVFITEAGPEIAVAATKSYVTQIYVLYLLACQISKKRPDGKLDEKIKFIIENFDEKLISKHFNSQKFFFIGRLCDSSTALEGALKLKEIAYAHSEGYPAGELKHGTLSLVDETALVVVILTQSSIKEKTLNAANEVKARGGKVIYITQFEDVEGDKILIPKASEDAMPILSVVPLQLLAYNFSLSKGLNPDMPRNLAKSVTVE